MKIELTYCDDDMDLTRKIGLTRDQLNSKGVNTKNMDYAFVIIGKVEQEIPKNFKKLIEEDNSFKWTEFGFNGFRWLVGISYKD